MTIQSKQNEVARVAKEIAGLKKQDASESKKEAANAKSIDQATRSLNSARNESSARSYSTKLIRLSSEAAKISEKRANLAKKLAEKTSKLHSAEQSLAKEGERERKKVTDAEKNREREQLSHQRAVSRELARQRDLSVPVKLTGSAKHKRYDAFISHASEDKDDFVRPLAEALVQAGFEIWFDEMTLTVGDSLRENIDKGLAASRYGIVVFSSAFFAKNWTKYELNGLVAKEMEGEKVVLPIWHKLSKQEVLAKSPSLADKLAINTSLSTIDEVVTQLSVVLRPK